MDTAQKLGILIFTGVPAIIGGGIFYSLFGSMVSVIVYEVLLYTATAVLCLKN